MTAQIAIQLLAAFVFGALIGIERQWRQRMAGVRTNALVSVGAAMFTTLANVTPDEMSPTRIAAQVVSGIGFLGAGVIIRDGLNIRGLNTAATLWCAAGVGVLSGSGHFLIAGVGVVLVLAANLGLRNLARALDRPAPGEATSTVGYLIKAQCRPDSEQRIRTILLTEAVNQGLILQSIQSEDVHGATRIEITASLLSETVRNRAVENIVGRASLDDAVSSVRWEMAPVEEDGLQSLLGRRTGLG